MKTKRKLYSNKVTDFHDKKLPKVDSSHICLAVISLDSIFKMDKNYYPQVFSNTLKKVIIHITHDLENCSHDSDEE